MKLKIQYIKGILCSSIAVMAMGALVGCASGPNANPIDPYESYNRGMFAFNDGLDEAILKPVATAYTDIAPKPVRTGVNNFFANLGDVWSFVNNVLQGRGQDAYESMVRLNVNTVFGLGGLLDIASEMGIDRHKQDFGLTLGHWGIKPGPYLVLPLLGPSTVRDTAALPVDFYGDVMSEIHDIGWRNSLYGLRVVDKRASLLSTSELLESAALDKYSFTRDAYLQIRNQRAGSRKKGVDDDAGKLPDEY